jgi:hypothetical protein
LGVDRRKMSLWVPIVEFYGGIKRATTSVPVF